MDNVKELDVTTDEGLAKACVVSCLESNHANTFALLEILRACPEPRPYRAVEEEVDKLPVMHMTHQNAHVLSDILVHCGALQKIEVPEESQEEDNDLQNSQEGASVSAPVEPELDADTQTDKPRISFASPLVADTAQEDEEEDMPIDYLLVITDAGKAALEDFEPSKRLRDMIDAEDACYHDVFRRVLQFCLDSDARKSDDIENAILGHPALTKPKQVFAGYFISRLETAGGIEWLDDGWHVTDSGRALLKTLPVDTSVHLQQKTA